MKCNERPMSVEKSTRWKFLKTNAGKRLDFLEFRLLIKRITLELAL